MRYKTSKSVDVDYKLLRSILQLQSHSTALLAKNSSATGNRLGGFGGTEKITIFTTAFLVSAA